MTQSFMTRYLRSQKEIAAEAKAHVLLKFKTSKETTFEINTPLFINAMRVEHIEMIKDKIMISCKGGNLFNYDSLTSYDQMEVADLKELQP